MLFLNKKTKFIDALIFLAIFSFYPQQSQAGAFSFITDLGNTSATKTHSYVSAKVSDDMFVLKPVINSNSLLLAAKSDLAVVDGVALVPDSGIEPIGGLHQSSVKTDKIISYIVKEGETLENIAKMFKVSENTVRWANDLQKGAKIKTGDVLIILPISGIQHTVAKSDTIESIAKKYKGDVDEIIRYNSLSREEGLAIGTIITIPDGEKSQPKSVSSSVASNIKKSQSLVDASGYFTRPVRTGVKTQGIHGLNAVDLAAPVGTDILAAADGVVIVAKEGGWSGGYGNYVVIEHSNGSQTLYAHMSDILVSVSSSVRKGDVIGYVGMTGKTTGPHVHFEVRGARNPF